MQDLKVTIVQSDLAWRNPEQNLSHFDKLIHKIGEPTDLIVLPEVFTTGFTMHPRPLSEKLRGRTLKWMFCKAIEMKSAIVGSYAVEVQGKLFNRLYVMYPNGRSVFYDKRHLFRMADEDKFFTAGDKRLIFKVKGWKLGAMICYDLRFPVWSRNIFDDGAYGYDGLVYVANWPEVRSNIWKTLLAARAIENQAYVVGVNRIGTDGNGISHSGDSMVVDPWGAKMTETRANQESVETVTLSASKLESFRKSIPFGMDWEKFELK